MVKRKAKRRKRQVKPVPPGNLVEPYWKGVQVRKGTPASQRGE